MERRHFFKTAILGALSGTAFIQSNLMATEKGELPTVPAEEGPADLAAVMGGTPEQMYHRAIEAMGGIGRFVKKGQKVTIKPNIAWDKKPELAANTNPDLVATIIKDCIAAGASSVTVFDHTCDEWEACYKHSGIKDAVEKAGGVMAFAHDEKYYREVKLPEGQNLKSAKIHEAILDCDVWINVPVLKHHGGAKMSVSMKNFMGIVWDRGVFHSHNLQQCIADIQTLDKKPVLNIVDAYRIMTQNGPKGKSLDDVQQAGALFMSTDIVAADTASIKFFNQFKNIDIAQVGHVALAEKAGVGTQDLSSLIVSRIKL